MSEGHLGAIRSWAQIVPSNSTTGEAPKARFARKPDRAQIAGLRP